MRKRKARIGYIDVARGIAILLMIIGHVLEKGLKRSIIYSFHMPLYIITSGYFYKDRPLKEELKKTVVGLLLPTVAIIIAVYFIRNVATGGIIPTLIDALKVVVVAHKYNYKIVYPFGDVGVLWFVYLLVGVRLLFKLNKKISKENDILLLIITLLESYLGYIIGIDGYWLPWSFDVILASMLFYFVGYIFKKYDLLDKIFGQPKMVIALSAIWLIGITRNWIELAPRYYSGGLWCYVIAIAGTIVVLRLSMFIEAKIKHCAKFLHAGLDILCSVVYNYKLFVTLNV